MSIYPLHWAGTTKVIEGRRYRISKVVSLGDDEYHVYHGTLKKTREIIKIKLVTIGPDEIVQRITKKRSKKHAGLFVK